MASVGRLLGHPSTGSTYLVLQAFSAVAASQRRVQWGTRLPNHSTSAYTRPERSWFGSDSRSTQPYVSDPESNTPGRTCGRTFLPASLSPR